MLIVAGQMRFWRFEAENSTRGGGVNLLVLMPVHLHNMTAKKEIEQGWNAIQDFFDGLAQLIVTHGVRILSSD